MPTVRMRGTIYETVLVTSIVGATVAPICTRRYGVERRDEGCTEAAARSAPGQHHHGVVGKTLCIRELLVRRCEEAVAGNIHRRFQSAVLK